MQILLDVDGCLLDYETPALAVAASITGHVATKEERSTTWDILDCCEQYRLHKDPIHEAWQAPGFCLGLQPIPGALDFVKRLSELGDVFLVTSHMKQAKMWVWEREQCLEKHGFTDHIEGIIHTHHKYKINGKFLIDDRVSNVVDWLNASADYQIGIILDHYGYDESDYAKISEKWPTLVQDGFVQYSITFNEVISAIEER